MEMTEKESPLSRILGDFDSDKGVPSWATYIENLIQEMKADEQTIDIHIKKHGIDKEINTERIKDILIINFTCERAVTRMVSLYYEIFDEKKILYNFFWGKENNYRSKIEFLKKILLSYDLSSLDKQDVQKGAKFLDRLNNIRNKLAHGDYKTAHQLDEKKYLQPGGIKKLKKDETFFIGRIFHCFKICLKQRVEVIRDLLKTDAQAQT